MYAVFPATTFRKNWFSSLLLFLSSHSRRLTLWVVSCSTQFENVYHCWWNIPSSFFAALWVKVSLNERKQHNRRACALCLLFHYEICLNFAHEWLLFYSSEIKKNESIEILLNLKNELEQIRKFSNRNRRLFDRRLLCKSFNFSFSFNLIDHQANRRKWKHSHSYLCREIIKPNKKQKMLTIWWSPYVRECECVCTRGVLSTCR